jgi:hypothetical protein
MLRCVGLDGYRRFGTDRSFRHVGNQLNLRRLPPRGLNYTATEVWRLTWQCYVATVLVYTVPFNGSFQQTSSGIIYGDIWYRKWWGTFGLNVLTDLVTGGRYQQENHSVTNTSILDSSGLQGCDTAKLAICSQHLTQIYYFHFKGLGGPWKKCLLGSDEP